jgi:hypothetical protein
MKLIETLSHMPFKDGDDLFFCKSSGVSTFNVPQSPTAQALGISAQTVSFHPWSLAVLRDGVILDIEIEGFQALSPSNLFCNPVVVGSTLSFIYARTLWRVPLSGGTPRRVRSGVFTGFCDGNKIVTSLPSCVDRSTTFTVEDGTSMESITTSFQSILRIIPQGTGYLITGLKDGQHKTLYRQSDSEKFYVTVDGEHIYKCCLDGDYVIHAKKEGGFEDRFLHRDLYTLIPDA